MSMTEGGSESVRIARKKKSRENRNRSGKRNSLENVEWDVTKTLPQAGQRESRENLIEGGIREGVQKINEEYREVRRRKKGNYLTWIDRTARQTLMMRDDDTKGTLLYYPGKQELMDAMRGRECDDDIHSPPQPPQIHSDILKRVKCLDRQNLAEFVDRVE